MLKTIENFIDNLFECVIIFFLALVISFICIFIKIDCSELTHHALRGNLIDKWHKHVCSTTYDGSNYDNDCKDRYTLYLDFGTSRLEKRMSRGDFNLFKIGDAIDYQYDRGKLGGIYHEVLTHVD
jgi:hypothetical protein